MPVQVVATAQLTCSFMTGPCTFNPLNAPTVLSGNMPSGTIMDCTIANIPSFIMCTSLANPITASQTAAASGVLTPGACTPIPAPWVPSAPTVLMSNKPALVQGSTCICSYGGTISVASPGQAKVLSG